MNNKTLATLALVGLLGTTGCSFSFNTDSNTPAIDTGDNAAVSGAATTTKDLVVNNTKPVIDVKTQIGISPNVTAEKEASVTQVTSADQLIGTWNVISTGIPRGETIVTIMKEKSYYKIVIDGKLYDSGYWTFAPYNFVLHTNAGGDIQPMKFVGLELSENGDLNLTDSPFTRKQVWQRVKQFLDVEVLSDRGLAFED